MLALLGSVPEARGDFDRGEEGPLLKGLRDRLGVWLSGRKLA